MTSPVGAVGRRRRRLRSLSSSAPPSSPDDGLRQGPGRSDERVDLVGDVVGRGAAADRVDDRVVALAPVLFFFF